MKKRAMLLLVLTAIITGTVGSPINASAEEETTTGSSVLSIEASTNKLDYGILTAGNSYTKTLAITNNSTDQTTFNLAIGVAEGLGDGSEYANIAEWTTVSGSGDYTLAGEASTNVSIRVKVPKDASVGGQYAALVASNSNEDTISLVAISAIIGGDGLKYDGEVSGVDVSWFNLNSKIESQINISNSGNVAFDSTYKFAVKSIFGGDPIFETSDTSTMYPGGASELHADWSEAPAVGLYNVVQSATYVNASGEIVEHTTERIIIMCPIWLIVVIGVVIIGIIVLIVVLVKKRNGKKGKSPRKNSKKASWEKSEE
ncbi:MAG: hypothetical protein ACK5MU_03115 [Candidatus Saccharimonadales bacterium]